MTAASGISFEFESRILERLRGDPTRAEDCANLYGVDEAEDVRLLAALQLPDTLLLLLLLLLPLHGPMAGVFGVGVDATEDIAGEAKANEDDDDRPVEGEVGGVM